MAIFTRPGHFYGSLGPAGELLALLLQAERTSHPLRTGAAYALSLSLPLILSLDLASVTQADCVWSGLSAKGKSP